MLKNELIHSNEQGGIMTIQQKLIRFNELRKIIPASRTTLWRWERAGIFPRRIKLGPNSVGWFDNEIRTWIDTRRDIGSEATNPTKPDETIGQSASAKRAVPIKENAA